MHFMNNMNVIDLFAGVGGFSKGFEKAGFNILLANEIDPVIATSYQKNHPNTYLVNDDIKKIAPQINKLNKKVEIIIGGPPCQGFSMAGARIRNDKDDVFLNDPRNYLFRDYFEIVKIVEPKFFLIENVPGMLTMENGLIIDEIKKLFSEPKYFRNGRYYLYITLLNAHDFGVPQLRKRLFIFGSKYNINFQKEIEESKKVFTDNGLITKTTISDAISDLNYLNSGEGFFKAEYKFDAKTNFQRERRINSRYLFNHTATNHTHLAIDRINRLLQGGRRLDLSEGKEIKSVHSGAYGRMSWNEPSKTIITRFDTPSSGVYIHPEMNRTITPREAARLQSFDDDFIFYGNKSSIIKQIGNAVPPLLSFFLANVIKRIQGRINT